MLKPGRRPHQSRGPEDPAGPARRAVDRPGHPRTPREVESAATLRPFNRRRLEMTAPKTSSKDRTEGRAPETDAARSLRVRWVPVPRPRLLRPARGVRSRHRHGGGRPSGSGSRPSPAPSAICSPSAGSRRPKHYDRGEPQAGLLPVDGVPDRPVAGEQHRQPGSGAVVREDLQSDPRQDWKEVSRRNRTPVWATAAWAGWPPASSTRSRRSRSRLSGTACATITASSGRTSLTAIRSNSLTRGFRAPTRGRSSARARR